MMGAMAYQIIRVSFVSSAVCLGENQRKYLSGLPCQRASNAENVSISCHHHNAIYLPHWNWSNKALVYHSKIYWNPYIDDNDVKYEPYIQQTWLSQPVACIQPFSTAWATKLSTYTYEFILLDANFVRSLLSRNIIWCFKLLTWLLANIQFWPACISFA